MGAVLMRWSLPSPISTWLPRVAVAVLWFCCARLGGVRLPCSHNPLPPRALTGCLWRRIGAYVTVDGFGTGGLSAVVDVSNLWMARALTAALAYPRAPQVLRDLKDAELYASDVRLSGRIHVVGGGGTEETVSCRG